MMQYNNKELTHSCFNKERIQLCCLVWIVVNQKQGKQELLNQYWIIMNTADQNDSQERPHNTHKVGFLEKQHNSAMMNCSAPSNVDNEQ